MCIGGGQQNLPKLASLLPPVLQVSQKLPPLASLDAEIASLQQQLAGMTSGGPFGGVNRKVVQQKLDQKLAMRRSIVDPSQAVGIPPVPSTPGLFGPRIEAPKVGVNDLKILLPTS